MRRQAAAFCLRKKLEIAALCVRELFYNNFFRISYIDAVMARMPAYGHFSRQ